MIKNKGTSKIQTIWKCSEFKYLFQTAIPSQGGDGVVLVVFVVSLVFFVTVSTVRQKAE